jgi:hyaluronan synthase
VTQLLKQILLRNLVTFITDENCGAVAGNVRAKQQNAILPKMLNVSFVMSFEFVRSAESQLGSVVIHQEH